MRIDMRRTEEVAQVVVFSDLIHCQSRARSPELQAEFAVLALQAMKYQLIAPCRRTEDLLRDPILNRL